VFKSVNLGQRKSGSGNQAQINLGGQHISEASEGESSNEKSDTTSSEGSGSDSSIEAAINGGDESEAQLYEKILAA
jgi:hypothetical protein